MGIFNLKKMNKHKSKEVKRKSVLLFPSKISKKKIKIKQFKCKWKNRTSKMKSSLLVTELCILSQNYNKTYSRTCKKNKFKIGIK
jgi:hypothetical protein